MNKMDLICGVNMINRLYFYGEFTFTKEYAIPTFSAVDIYDSDKFKATHRWYQVSWFGKSFNIEKQVKDGKKTPAVYFKLTDVILAFSRLLS